MNISSIADNAKSFGSIENISENQSNCVLIKGAAKNNTNRNFINVEWQVLKHLVL